LNHDAAEVMLGCQAADAANEAGLAGVAPAVVGVASFEAPPGCVLKKRSDRPPASVASTTHAGQSCFGYRVEAVEGDDTQADRGEGERAHSTALTCGG
jgi:hypothetical protein